MVGATAASHHHLWLANGWRDAAKRAKALDS
jgi:hypothetical protein